MLAEIFLVRLEMQLRVAAANSAPASIDKRFVPVTLPRETVQQLTNLRKVDWDCPVLC